MWDIDSQDWATHNLGKEKIEYNKVLKDGATGHIALNHEVNCACCCVCKWLLMFHCLQVYDQTVNELVPWVIDELKDKVKFVTVAECLGMEPYLWAS